MVHAREVAVEFLGADGLAHLVEQFAVVFGGPHAPVPTGVDVGHVQHRDGALHVVDDFEHLFEAAPQLLATGGLDADLRRRAVLDPWEDGELVIVVVPDGFEAIDHAGEHVGHGFVGFPAASGLAVVAGVERDVTGVDGAGGLERGLNLGQRAAELHAAAEQLAVVGPVDVHLEPGLFREHARLPVLVEVLRLNHADGLRLHGLKAEGDDVVHAFDNGASFARKRDARGSELHRHLIPPIAAEMVPHEEPFPVKVLPHPAKVSRYDPS